MVYFKTSLYLCRASGASASAPAAARARTAATKKPTLTDLDEHIRRLYPGDASGKMKPTTRLQIGKVRVPNAFRMDVSGDENDCLIHSFLTCVCPSFRTLSKAHKNAFGRRFRTEWFPAAVEAHPGRETPKQRAEVTEHMTDPAQPFLSEADLAFLLDFFETSALVFQKATRGLSGVAVANEAQMAEVGFRSDTDPILIYGSGFHFEPVQKDGAYSLPRAEVRALVQAVQGDKFQPTALGSIYRFEVGQTVRYRGERLVVADRSTHNDNTEQFYYLLPAGVVAAFTTAQLKSGDFTKHPGVVKAAEADVAGV